MNTTIISSLSAKIEDTVLDAALSLETEDEREAFLQLFFHNNPRGLTRMRALLKRHGESSAFFLDLNKHSSVLAKDILEPEEEPTAVPQNGETEKPGSLIGPYKLLSRIGEGGGGVVYEVEQQSPVFRRVALKILRPGMDTESLIARFTGERHTLALMDHPNIAHIYDAGATVAGRPYFVMEMVDGERITSFCDANRLDIVARIQLFIQVCNAIEHAHQKGVIHRDIKPSNILVTLQDGAPTPKVIDFGIAKAPRPDRSPRQMERTTLDQIVGTLPYMSPEQVDMTGIDVDTRSDVYSLGVLLHELLGGFPPFKEEFLAGAGMSEVRRILLEVEPVPLSRMLEDTTAEDFAKIAHARSEQPSRLLARIRGELDWIIAMALAKDRNRRYQTVNALAAELRRFLNNEPVTARRPSRFYLLAKFVQRNRLACAFGLAVAVSVTAGLGVSTVMYFREHDARKEQERLTKVLEDARAQAQSRANVSQAAVLLSAGRLDEADELLRENPPTSIDPSHEAAEVFRTLGSRNAMRAQWKRAMDYFLLLAQANRLDHPGQIIFKSDLLTLASVLLKNGDQAAYEKFRSDTLERFLPATDPSRAEHVLKSCLLTPASKEMLDRLQPASLVCAEGFRTRTGPHPGWEALTLALYHYRRGDLPGTQKWARRALSFEDNTGSRSAAALSLMAMAEFQSGSTAKAEGDLAEAQRLVLKGTQFGLTWNEIALGSWFSWVVAEILLDEANAKAANPATIEMPAHFSE